MSDEPTKDVAVPDDAETMDEQDLNATAGGVAGDYPSGDGSASAGTASSLFSHADLQRHVVSDPTKPRKLS